MLGSVAIEPVLGHMFNSEGDKWLKSRTDVAWKPLWTSSVENGKC